MEHLNFSATLDESLRKWLWQTSYANYWRVARWYELEDLVGDGYMIAAKIMDTYRGTIINQRHFMALVMVAFNNHIISQARKRRRGDDIRIVHAAPKNVDHEWWIDSLLGHVQHNGMVVRLTSQAKFPVDAVIALFTTEQGVMETRRHPQRSHEPLNRYLCRVLGLDHRDYDLPALVHSFIVGRGIYFLHQPVKTT